QVPGVVRVEVEDDVGGLAPVDDERLTVLARRDPAERALPRPAVAGLVVPVDVRHAVRGPQPLERVGHAGEVLRRLGRHAHAVDTCRRSAMAVVMSSTASATGTPLRWEPSRKRKETAPASASSPPAMRMKGTFSFVALRIFLLKRSSLRSTSARTPRARSWATTSAR